MEVNERVCKRASSKKIFHVGDVYLCNDSPVIDLFVLDLLALKALIGVPLAAEIVAAGLAPLDIVAE